MRGWSWSFVAAGLLAGLWLPPAWAQGGIYTCVDAKGRRLTSDRPILDCLDREQSELGPTGKVIRKLGPSMTMEERAAEEERQRKEVEERNRQMEEKRRDRALLSRYPDRATHDKERNGALAAVDEVIATANRRSSELQWQHKKLVSELEFYGGDMKKAPAHLKRRFDEIEQSTAVQKRFIANQEEEKKRINARYDLELARLTGLWNAGARPATATPTAAAPAPARK
ncbi:MAG TPA: DUF4124 domain-containing protein [Ramlibacter sp.]|nr:DUF4124 domain-containing protein [Ramlibacter sp.]